MAGTDESGGRQVSLERQFLKLASTYLACRWKAMGHELIANQHVGELPFYLLGMLDYAYEMKLLLKEAR